MTELSIGRRARWLLVPLAAGVVALALVPVIGDYESWTVGDIPRSLAVIALFAALPAGLLLAFVQSRWG